MAPSGRAEEVAQALFPAQIISEKIGEHRSPFMEYDMIGALDFQWGGQAIFDGFIVFFVQFFLECSEHAVPYDEKHAHVFVEVQYIGCVMHPVMGGGYQNIFQPAQFAHMFRVYQDPPDLGDGIHKEDVHRLKSKEAQWDEIQKTVERLKN